MIILSRIILPLIFALSSLVVLFMNKHPGYEYLFLHPIAYSISFSLILYKSIASVRFRPFLFVFTLIGFLRFVALPLLVVISGHYSGRSRAEPLDISYQNAIFLMLWELIACTVLIVILEARQIKFINKIRKPLNEASSKNYIYYLFIVSSIFLLILNPSSLFYINFISPSLLEPSSEPNFIINLTVYCFLIAKTLFCLEILKRLNQRNSSIAFIAALIITALNVSIFLGTNKSDILISGIASGLVLYQLYKKRAILPLAILGIFTLIILLTVNTYRNPVNTVHDNKLAARADIIQVYSGGVYNVAIALETKEYYPESTDMEVLMFDIFRPMIGPNIFLKDKVQRYSNIYFNDRMWTHIDRRSQIIPMIGQANLFLGYIFSPLFSIFFIFLAYKLERVFFATQNIEVYYFLCLALIRLGFIFGQNTMNMINDLSMNLFLFLAIFVLNRFFKKL